MTESPTRDVVERLDDAFSNDEWGLFSDAKAEIQRLRLLVSDHEAAARSVRELTRKLDVSMHGEELAAPQASLCDLIPLAERLRSELEKAQKVISPKTLTEMNTLAYLVANANLGKGGTVRCEGPTEYEINRARPWVMLVLEVLREFAAAPSPTGTEAA